MQKDFEKWHKLKANINENRQEPPFHEGEIWWCALGANIGVEEDGKNDLFERPVLVFHKFNKDMFWGLPITSQEKHGFYDHPLFFRGKQITVLISQMRLLSSKRLIRCMGKVQTRKFLKVTLFLSLFLKKQNGSPVGSSVASNQSSKPLG